MAAFLPHRCHASAQPNCTAGKHLVFGVLLEALHLALLLNLQAESSVTTTMSARTQPAQRVGAAVG